MSQEEKSRPVVPVHECWDDDEANIIVSVLSNGGLEAFTSSQISHSVFPLETGELGKVLVLVDEDKAEDAKRIIAEHRASAEGGMSPE